MGQSKISSFFEAVANVLIGYWVAIAAQLIIFPLYGVHLPMTSNLAIGALFTIVSLVRSYTLRRFFNWIHHGHRFISK